MTIAYSYQRFSTKIQAKGDSLRRQLELASNYCDTHNLTLSDSSFQDLGLSAYSGENISSGSGLFKFIQAVEAGVITTGSYLLVESLDRLSRQQVSVALQQLLHLVNDLGITVVTLLDNKVYTTQPDLHDLMISLAIMERAFEESETKSKRVSAAWANKRNNPETAKKTKTCPFWLKLDTSKNQYKVIEEQAEIVRSVFQMSIDGFGVLKIAEILNKQGIKPPKNGNWATTSVNRILAERRVLGEYQPHIRKDGKRVPIGEPIQNQYPVIIDENTFHLSAARRTNRTLTRKGRRGNHFSNLFIDVAVCSDCGARMIYKDKGNSLVYLTCSNRIKKVCDNKPVRYELFNKLIHQVYLTPLFHRHFIELAQPQAQPQSESLEVLESRLMSANNELNALLESVGEVTNSVIQKQIATRAASITDIENKITNFQQSEAETSTASVHQNFNEALQHVSDCFDFTKSNDELFKLRSKLNRALSVALGSMKVLNDKGDVSVEMKGWKYHFLKGEWGVIETPFDSVA